MMGMLCQRNLDASYPFVFQVVIPMDTSGFWCCLVVETAKGQNKCVRFFLKVEVLDCAGSLQPREHDDDQKIGIALRCVDAIPAIKCDWSLQIVQTMCRMKLYAIVWQGSGWKGNITILVDYLSRDKIRKQSLASKSGSHCGYHFLIPVSRLPENIF